MKPFAYTRAADAAGALALAERAPGTKFLAGGTNLIDLMKMGVEQPTRLVDITRLPLNTIEDRAVARASAPWCATAIWRRIR